MAHSYRMQGTCATEVTFDLEEGLLRNVQFRGGCDGNLKAVTVLLEGRSAREAKVLLAGIRCGRKRTSCPDQLSKALANACPSLPRWRAVRINRGIESGGNKLSPTF